MNLQFKFSGETDTHGRRRVLDSLAAEGAEIEQIFPDDANADLAALYTVRLADDQLFATILRRLKRSQKVAFAEAEPTRHQYLPQEIDVQPRSRS